MKFVMRAANAYDADMVSEETGLSFVVLDERTGELVPEVSLAVQSQKDEADINTLVKRWGLTGEIPVLDRQPLDFDSVPEGFDFMAAQGILNAGRDSFMELPADVRGRFLNDPVRFMDFAIQRGADGVLVNKDELTKLGMIDIVAPPAVPADIALLKEIRDGLGAVGGKSGAAPGGNS